MVRRVDLGKLRPPKSKPPEKFLNIFVKGKVIKLKEKGKIRSGGCDFQS